MSIPEAWLWPAVLRALLVAVLVATAAAVVSPMLRRPGSRPIWIALFLVWMTPALVVAYAWGNLVVLTPGPRQEILYAGLSVARLLPLAVVLGQLLPAAAVTPAGLHCHDLIGRRGRPLALRWHGGGAKRAAVAAVVFVVAFAEFELAALLGVRTWTVWLFDAQVGGLALTETLRAGSLPCLIQVAALLFAAGATRPPGGWRTGGSRLPVVRTGTGTGTGTGVGGNGDGGRARRAGGAAILVAVVLVAAAIPLYGLLPGLADLRGQVQLLAELRWTLLFGSAAAACAVALAFWAPITVVGILLLPGLCGGLVTGLLVQAAFQLPSLAPLYDSPLPLLVGWSLYLLPIALALRLLSRRPAADRGRHAAILLSAAADPAQRRAGWRLRCEVEGVRVLLAFGVCGAAAAGEVVLGQLLAPASMPPAAPRLYNLMHYGRAAGLSAMVVWLLLTLGLLLAIVLAGLRLLRAGRVPSGPRR